ncbi:MAG: glycosyl hydrolase family 28-related protein [Terriglobia bacterium]
MHRLSCTTFLIVVFMMLTQNGRMLVAQSFPLRPGRASDGGRYGQFFDKGGMVFNVRAFGAKGDGKTDDSSSIFAATKAAASAHGTLYFPQGVYIIKSPWNLTAITGLRIEGAGPSSGPTGISGVATELLYKGSALPSECPYDLTSSTWVSISDITLDSVPPTACTLLLGSATSGGSKDLEFKHDVFQRAVVATVADAGAESLMFSDCDIVYGPGRGLLLSSNGLVGYGISSAFGYKYVPHSMTQVTYRGGEIVTVGQGRGVELDGTGLGTVLTCSDLTFFGVFFQGTGSGNAAFYVKGAAWALLIYGARYEVDAQTGTCYFLRAAPGAKISDLEITGFDGGSTNGQGIDCLYSSPGARAEIGNGVVYGIDTPIVWDGSLYGIDFRSGSVDDISVTGDVVHCSFRARHGLGTFHVTGRLFADVEDYKNVVELEYLRSGSSSYTFNAANSPIGHYTASFASDFCSLDFTKAFRTDFIVLNVNRVNAQAAFANSHLGHITCPAAGPSKRVRITASFSGTPNWFVVRVN